MTRVGWLIDEVPFPGGAEMTAAEFRAAAPEGVEVVDCRPGEITEGLDVYVIHNCLSYGVDDLNLTLPDPAEKHAVFKYWHDVGPHVPRELKTWLALNAKPICCSPLQADAMDLPGAALIPPAIDLAPFVAAGSEANGSRRGNVSVGSWANPGKAPHLAADWGAEHGGLDFYGGGVCAPAGSRPVPHSTLPLLLANYERFVFLPTALEPFGRTVVEAWAAGCEVVTNGLVGARYWIEENPEALDSAAEDFWAVVLA